MALFTRRLQALLDEAQGRGLLDSGSAHSLLSLAEERETRRGRLSLASVLGGLGGGVAILGVILLVSANWDALGDGLKMAGFLILLAATHGAGLWIRWSGKPYPKTAAALNFLGAGLFLAGVGLVSQIYHLSGNPPRAILLWLVAILPLAFLLRSGPIAALSVFALFLWSHMEGGHPGSPLRMYGFASFLVMEIGLGAALLGISAPLQDFEAGIARVLRFCGAAILFYAVWMLGFLRHFSPARSSGPGSWILPAAALLLGIAAVAAAGKRLADEAPALQWRLTALLLSLPVLAGFALHLHLNGGSGGYGTAGILVSVAAWAIWFLLALWCVAFGARTGRKAYLNAGAAAVGLGVISRFFDLIGGMAETGTIFVIGGLLLVATGWATEKWRRGIAAAMEETGKCA